MKEQEIRPKKLFEEYLKLSKIDGSKLSHNDFISIDCPACFSKELSLQFKKDEFQFKKCNRCRTLFCSPRPNKKQLDFLYSTSKSSEYWSKVFFPAVEDVRRQKLFYPKAKMIKELIENKKLTVENLCDVGAGHGVFLEELSKQLSGAVTLAAIEPDKNSASRCEEKGIKVLNKNVENSDEWKEKFDFVISSEVIEHIYEPMEFVSSLYNLLRPGGYLLITGLGYEGFDILMLQEQSKSVSPPHHLNFFSQQGFEILFKKAGFSFVEIWTPGKLDLDIVLNSSIENEFIETLRFRGDEVLKRFQEFLSQNNLSSHVWILAQKSEN